MVSRTPPPPAPLPLQPSVARWRLERRSGALWLASEALAWFGLAELAAHDWKAQLLPRIAAADRSRWIDALLRALDGVAVDCQIATHPPAPPRLLRLIGDENSAGDSVGGLLIDVSRDVRERDALLELAGLQRSFIDALPWPTCAFDDHGDVVLANRLWRRCADCAVQLEGETIALPALPEWLARQPLRFASADAAAGKLLAARLIDHGGDSQPAWLRRSAIRQAGTPLHLLSVESRPDTP
jgi:PAS domain-containing protein